jgi:hypothetical protein
VYQHLLHSVIYVEYMTLLQEEGVVHALEHWPSLAEAVSVPLLFVSLSAMF